jgi:hypothetical protein
MQAAQTRLPPEEAFPVLAAMQRARLFDQQSSLGDASQCLLCPCDASTPQCLNCKGRTHTTCLIASERTRRSAQHDGTLLRSVACPLCGVLLPSEQPGLVLDYMEAYSAASHTHELAELTRQLAALAIAANQQPPARDATTVERWNRILCHSEQPEQLHSSAETAGAAQKALVWRKPPYKKYAGAPQYPASTTAATATEHTEHTMRSVPAPMETAGLVSEPFPPSLFSHALALSLALSRVRHSKAPLARHSTPRVLLQLPPRSTPSTPCGPCLRPWRPQVSSPKKNLSPRRSSRTLSRALSRSLARHSTPPLARHRPFCSCGSLRAARSGRAEPAARPYGYHRFVSRPRSRRATCPMRKSTPAGAPEYQREYFCGGGGGGARGSLPTVPPRQVTSSSRCSRSRSASLTISRSSERK